MQLTRSFRLVLLGGLLVLLLPGVSAAQWVLGGPVDQLGVSQPSSGPLIVGDQTDGATSSGLPGSFTDALIGLTGEELALAPAVTVFTQTLTTPGQYTSTFTLGANYAASGSVLTLGIDPVTIQLDQTNLGGTPTPARVRFWLVVPWEYTAVPPFVSLSGAYTFDISSSKATLGASDLVKIESCTLEGQTMLLTTAVAAVCNGPGTILHAAFSAGSGTSTPLSFNGALSGVAKSNTRHTFTGLFEIRIENGVPMESITFSNFQFEMLATPTELSPALSGPARLVLVLALIVTVAGSLGLRSRFRGVA